MITANHINKKFDGIEAVKDISVNIKNGEVFGLIGTNGAGKHISAHGVRCFKA